MATVRSQRVRTKGYKAVGHGREAQLAEQARQAGSPISGRSDGRYYNATESEWELRYPRRIRTRRERRRRR